MGGLILAAAASGSGKTTLTLGLLRHWRDQGFTVGAAKAGPDYIDSGFLSAAAGSACVNLDTWAMRSTTVRGLAGGVAARHDVVVCEGVMGLFDGAFGGMGGGARSAPGSTAALALATGWPVVLVIDGRRQAGSAGALLRGFATFDAAVRLAGVIFNRVASEKHAAVLHQSAALGAPGVPVLGCVGRDPRLALPSRHLGLVQAAETADLEKFLGAAAAAVAGGVDCAALLGLAESGREVARPLALAQAPALAPMGQRIAVAQDVAFAFCYTSVVDGWRQAGATVVPFSPLADEAPDAGADAVYLPGGYPELHAGRLAGNGRFMAGVRDAAGRGAAIWGECGGYMVMGQRLQDADGDWHAMAGLLPLVTSMESGRLHLGYREARLVADTALGGAGTAYRGHEFHHARVVAEGPGTPLAQVRDAAGTDLGAAGLVDGRVTGSFMHFIDRVAA